MGWQARSPQLRAPREPRAGPHPRAVSTTRDGRTRVVSHVTPRPSSLQGGLRGWWGPGRLAPRLPGGFWADPPPPTGSGPSLGASAPPRATPSGLTEWLLCLVTLPWWDGGGAGATQGHCLQWDCLSPEGHQCVLLGSRTLGPSLTNLSVPKSQKGKVHPPGRLPSFCAPQTCLCTFPLGSWETKTPLPFLGGVWKVWGPLPLEAPWQERGPWQGNE